MKKAKLLIAIAAAAIGVTAVSAVAVSVNSGALGEVIRASRAPVAQMEERGSGFWTPGNSVYLYMDAGARWNEADAKYAVYYLDNTGKYAWTDILSLIGQDTLIINETEVTYDVYEGRVPEVEGVSVWDKGLNIVRLNPEAVEPSWDYKWDQSHNVNYYETGCNLLRPEFDEFNTTNVNWEIFSAEERIKIWANTAEWYSGDICKDDNSTDELALSEAWNKSATSFKALGMDVQSYFSNLDWVSLEDGNQVKDIAARYDYIIGKYTELENFALRNSQI